MGIFLLIISGIVFHFKGSFSSNILNSIVLYSSLALLIASILTFLIGALLGFLKYVSIKFSIGENAFNIKHGILNTIQTSIPYRQIQGVNIKQSFSNRMTGVSRLEITTAGNDNDDKKANIEGVFEVIDANLAKELREKLLQRANVQIVKESSPTNQSL